MGMSETIDSILCFLHDYCNSYWIMPLFQAFPNLDKEKVFDAPWPKRKLYLQSAMQKIYYETLPQMDKKTAAINEYWQGKETDVNQAFSETFGIDFNALFNNMVAETSLNTICPRFLSETRFTFFYRKTPEQFMDTALHEIIHFAWFHIWQNTFHDDRREYEYSHLKWLLSETVVDTFANNSKIGELFSEHGRKQAVYPLFYSMIVGGRPILETLADLYKASDTAGFMTAAYEYYKTHEMEIRSQFETPIKKPNIIRPETEPK
jgi:hypothetical protein